MAKDKHIKRKAEKARKKREKEMAFKPERKWLWIALLLSFIAYGKIYDNQTTNYDDDIYVTENSLIQNMELGSLYSEFYWNQYSPLAMTIMGLEYKAFSGNETMLRFVSVLIHLACVLLVFLIVRRLFRNDFIAGLTALLFGVHPLQVESVAWLTASMKIGTYAMFFLLSVYSYLQYLDRNRSKDMLLSILFFLASCLCKEQAVILPLVLVLLDYMKGQSPFHIKTWLSKWPYFIISLIFGVITLKASEGGAPADKVYDFVLAERVLFAFYSTGMYWLKLIMPSDLSMFYTYPVKGEIPVYYFFFPIMVFALLFLLWRAYTKDQKWLVFGLAFFFINVLLTALTAVMSVRDVIMADRYVYLPAIGAFFLFAYGVEKIAERKSSMRWVAMAMAMVYTVVAYQRVGAWENSITLFSDVIEKGSYQGKDNPYLALAHNNRGISYKRQGKLDKAMKDYEAAIRVNPNYPNGYLNRGNIHFDAGRDELAMQDYDKVLELKPDNQKALSSRGSIYARKGNFERALQDMNEAIRLDKYFVDAYSNRALTYINMGRHDEALADCNTILSMTPDKDDMYEFRGYIQLQKGDFQSALGDFDKAIAMNPRGSYYYNRALTKQKLGDKAGARADAKQAQAKGVKIPESFMRSLN